MSSVMHDCLEAVLGVEFWHHCFFILKIRVKWEKALYPTIDMFQHFNNFWILLVGRLLGGVATSILYSAFESWVIYEHNKVGLSSNRQQYRFELISEGQDGQLETSVKTQATKKKSL